MRPRGEVEADATEQSGDGKRIELPYYQVTLAWSATQIGPDGMNMMLKNLAAVSSRKAGGADERRWRSFQYSGFFEYWIGR